MRTARLEGGGIITGWLLQLLAILAVISLIAYELIAVGVANVAVDDRARTIAQVARDAHRDGRSLPATVEATEAALQDADADAELVSLEEVDGELVITLAKRARTLLIHRVGPLEDFATASTTRRVRWQS